MTEPQIHVGGWAAAGAQQTYIAWDGAFGSATDGAVRRFQPAYGPTADGVAADIVVSGHATLQVYRVAETCGFSGLEACVHSWQHVDRRGQYPSGGSGSWWWESGVV
ncbi:peptidoglycan-binding domain-containing protein [Streptomyces sp. NPDC004629]|uniref:peptidoglycan-binding domain-containing protein n=1 Tax=Streptomyces sp. NPDC004629 TaxID=3364705 RepID=UPI0036BD00BB